MAEKLEPAAPRHQVFRRKGVFVVLVVVGTWIVWTKVSRNLREAGERVPVVVDRKLDLDQLRPQVEHFCGACHVVPSPANFPKQAWGHEVEQGFRFFYESRRTDLTVPRQIDVEEFFRQQAPDTLVMSAVNKAEAAGTLQFQQRNVRNETAGAPAVSYVAWLELMPEHRRQLVFCDMSAGGVYLWDPRQDAARPVKLATLSHPAHVTVSDLDHDGRSDLVVADLGSRLPEDHDRGRVIWLRRRPAGRTNVPEPESEWETVVLQDKLGRVADVQPGDFDGDGDDDLVVAEFGWLTTGRILLLENQGMTDGVPKFHLRVLDDRHGTIHVPVVDLNKDGRPDFVALISQEHETIVAFLNEGPGEFRRETIMTARDPSYGSSGIQLIDLDQDGDLDVLYSNGDSFDRKYLRPFHGVQWLENRGEFPFTLHPLTQMPGVHRALAGDLDGDGDLDLVAVSLLPHIHASQDVEGRPLASVIWMEQTRKGEFVRHPLEVGNCFHAACELADVDDDGDLDLVVGQFADNVEDGGRWLTVWVNEGVSK